MNIANMPSHLLREALELRERLEQIESTFNNGTAVSTGKRGRKLGTKLSPEHRKAMSEAQRARWAAKKEPAKTEAPAPEKKKRVMSQAARSKIAAAQRARWAKAKK
jgi:hypothetical protein